MQDEVSSNIHRFRHRKYNKLIAFFEYRIELFLLTNSPYAGREESVINYQIVGFLYGSPPSNQLQVNKKECQWN
jgi:hypothetical protein